MHADFSGDDGGTGPIYYGIPINRVDSNPSKGQVFPSGQMQFSAYGDESDPGELNTNPLNLPICTTHDMPMN